jgi:hypothetical protein
MADQTSLAYPHAPQIEVLIIEEHGAESRWEGSAAAEQRCIFVERTRR